MRWVTALFAVLAATALSGTAEDSSALGGAGLQEVSTGAGLEPRPEFAAEKARVEAAVRARHGTVFFMHVHKGGGTTICNLAKQSKVMVPAMAQSSSWMGKNCNPKAEDRRRAWEAAPSELVAYARTSHPRVLNFYAIECRLPATLPWGQFALLGVMRQPMRHMFSNCFGLKPRCLRNYHNRQLALYVGCAISFGIHGNESAVPPVPPTSLQCNADKFDQLRPMTREHLEAGKRRIERFSLVIPTERLGDAQPLLSDKFGWRASSATRYRGGTRVRASEYDQLEARLRKAGTLHAHVLANQALDTELYAHAVALFDAELAVLP